MDGMDKEIDDAEYGDPPEGYDFLVTGPETFGRVLEAGPNVQGLQTRRLRSAATGFVVSLAVALGIGLGLYAAGLIQAPLLVGRLSWT